MINMISGLWIISDISQGRSERGNWTDGTNELASWFPVSSDRRRAHRVLFEEEDQWSQDRARYHPRGRPLQVRTMGSTRYVRTWSQIVEIDKHELLNLVNYNFLDHLLLYVHTSLLVFLMLHFILLVTWFLYIASGWSLTFQFYSFIDMEEDSLIN